MDGWPRCSKALTTVNTHCRGAPDCPCSGVAPSLHERVAATVVFVENGLLVDVLHLGQEMGLETGEVARFVVVGAQELGRLDLTREHRRLAGNVQLEKAGHASDDVDAFPIMWKPIIQ